MNKKGLTLIEIVVSIALISIVMIFLFQIIMTIKNANERQNNRSNNKASVLIITREVQKDLDSFGMENTPTTSCNLNDSSNNIIPSSASRVNCIKLLYDGNNVKNNEGYILYYENNNKYFLAYKRGKGNVIETQTVREISIEPKDNLDIVIDRVGNVNDYSIRMIMPIRDNTENYDLDINYIYTKAFKKQVQVISENGLAYNLKGSGKYYPNDVVNVSFDYDSVLNQLESVECINNLCPTTNKFSFTMPDEDVIVKINIRADIVPPTCTTNITGGDYINGWTVGVTCSDVGSGCKEGYQTHVGVKQNRTFMVEDKAGNKGYCNVNVPVDKNPPTCSVQNVGGNIIIGYSARVICHDNESGCEKNEYTVSGLTQNQNFEVKDNAGNKGYCYSNINFHKPSFANDSWDVIVSYVRKGYGYIYPVGSEKIINISGSNYRIRVANNSTPSECFTSGFSQTGCGFVVEFAEIIEKKPMNTWQTNKNGWTGSYLRGYANGEFFNKLPWDLRNIIIDTYVVSGRGNSDRNPNRNDGNWDSVDKIYLLSGHEIFENGSSRPVSTFDSAYYTTRQLDYYKSKGVYTDNFSGAIKKFNGVNEWWRMRTSEFTNDTRFIHVIAEGGYSGHYADGYGGFSPAFRIG